MEMTSSMIGGFRVGGTVIMCLTKNDDIGIGVRVVTNKVLSQLMVFWAKTRNQAPPFEEVIMIDCFKCKFFTTNKTSAINI